MAQLGGLVVSLEANMARFQSDMNRSAGVTEQAMRRMGDSSARTEQAMARLNATAASAKAALANLAVGVIGGIGAGQLVALTDEYTKFTAQLRLATDSQASFVQATEDVRRIAQLAQTDMAGTGVLYARIASATREMGMSQQTVADVTETVALALKVSGASAAEAASAQLQLSQAFASGVLRGEEFNAVNEAAPRLMQALADGMGVPVGALREMAAAGLLTTEVLATALPKALSALRPEAKSVETISGAFTDLKNQVMEFVGTEAQASGAVNALTTGIGALSRNLDLLLGITMTLGASKFAQWTARVAENAYDAAMATHAQTAATLKVTQADVAATASSLALANARVAELRASVLAAEGAVQLAIATNGLIPAQARAAQAAAAHTAALAALATAQKSASVSTGLASRALGLLGGPIGAITTLLGLGATAWMVWGDSAKTSSEKAVAESEDGTKKLIANLDKQIAKIRERNELEGLGIKTSSSDSEAKQGLDALALRINQAMKGEGEFAGLNMEARTERARLLGLQYAQVLAKSEIVATDNLKRESQNRSKVIEEEMAKYATNAQKLTAELNRVRTALGGEIPADLERLIKEKFQGGDASSKDAETKRLLEQDAAGWVAYIDAMEAEYERFLLEKAAMDQEAMRQEELARVDRESAYVQMIDQQIEEERRKADELHELNKKVSEDQKKAMEEATEFSKQAARNMQTALGQEFFDVMQGKTDDLGKAFTNMLQRMAAELAAAQVMNFLIGDFAKTGKIGGLIGSFLPGRANGGYVSPGTTYMVGERGPELLTLGGMSGSVTPHHQLSGKSGSPSSITYAPQIHIDSRADRAQVMTDVQRAIQQGNAELVEKLQRSRMIPA